MSKTILVIILIFGLVITMIPTIFAAEMPIFKEPNEASFKSELTLDNPGILPTNPFYFLKKFKRSLTRAFTFSALSKVRYELDVADEKLAELKLIEEIDPNNKEAILISLYNYTDNVVRLNSSTKSIRDIANNSDVDQVIKKLELEMVRHSSILSDLATAHEDLADAFDYTLSLIAAIKAN